jgi:uncharacterized protein
MGIRLVFFLLALGAIWLIVRSYWRTNKSLPQNQKPQIKSGKMIACQHCGLHIPIEEAVKNGDDYYCSQEHATLQNDNQDH